MTNDYRSPSPAPTTRWALWVAIAVLVAAAVLGGFFIIVGDQDNLAGRAWLTLLLVAAFAGAVLVDISVSDGPNRWYLAVSVVLNTVLVAIGLLKIWAGPGQHVYSSINSDGPFQFFRFLAIIVLVRAALIITQLYGLAMVARARVQLMRGFAFAALVFMWLIVVFLGFPAAIPGPDWPSWWWRCSGACALVAVVLAAIPLVVRAFEPRKPKPQIRPNYYPYAGLPGQGFPAPGTTPPFAAYPQAGYQQARQPQSGYPRGGGYPRAAYPQAGYPQGGYPPGAYPQTGYSQGVYSQAGPAFSPGHGPGGYPTRVPAPGTVPPNGYSVAGPAQPGYSQVQQAPSGSPQPQADNVQGQSQAAVPQAQFEVQPEQSQTEYAQAESQTIQPQSPEAQAGYPQPQAAPDHPQQSS